MASSIETLEAPTVDIPDDSAINTSLTSTTVDVLDPPEVVISRTSTADVVRPTMASVTQITISSASEVSKVNDTQPSLSPIDITETSTIQFSESETSAVDIFEHEYRKFESKLKEGDRTAFRFTTILDVKETITQLELHRQKYNQKWTFVGKLEQYSNVIDFVPQGSQYVAFLWGPLNFLLPLAATFRDAFVMLLDAYNRLGNSIPQLEGFKHIILSDSHIQNILAWIYGDILEFHRRILSFFQQRCKWIHKLMYHTT